MIIKVIMSLSKETKNCYRYEAKTNDTPPVDCIYLQKSALNGQPAPKQVTVEVLFT